MGSPPDTRLKTPHLSLVLPAYNAAARLPSTLVAVDEFRRSCAASLEVLFVDDCSTDGQTPGLLDRYAQTRPGVEVIHNARNRGKGYSVARGLLAARGRFRVFTDIDLAYPLGEALKILDALESGNDVAIACRVLPESRYVMSPSFFHYLYTRHLMSRAFNTMVRLLLLPGELDTQAGLKGFTANAAEAIFSRTTIPRFGFDIESLYIAHHLDLPVKRVAVQFRYDEEPTTVRFARDSLRMLRDIAKVRWYGWTGRYTHATGPFAAEPIPAAFGDPKFEAPSVEAPAGAVAHAS